jgi:hypothetical protein
MKAHESLLVLARPALGCLTSLARSRPGRLILAVDCVLILAHVALTLTPRAIRPYHSSYLRLDAGHGIAKAFECAMLAIGIVAMVDLASHTRKPAYWLLGVLASYLLIDDAFALHDMFGKALLHSHRHVGELLSSLIVGTLFTTWWMSCFARSDERMRIFLSAAALILAYTITFGIGVDALHNAFVPRHTLLDGAATLVEEGNELIGLTLLGGFLLRSRRREMLEDTPSTPSAIASDSS